MASCSASYAFLSGFPPVNVALAASWLAIADTGVAVPLLEAGLEGVAEPFAVLVFPAGILRQKQRDEVVLKGRVAASRNGITFTLSEIDGHDRVKNTSTAGTGALVIHTETENIIQHLEWGAWYQG